jgi:ABC-type nickel/cobalt efflux system permease component RcnA
MANKRAFQLLILTILVTAGLLGAPHQSLAHPLGNFSISHYSAMRIESDTLRLRYVIDMAEIPTFQELQGAAIAPQESDPRLPAYLSQRIDELRAGLSVELNGQRLPLDLETSEVIFPPGAGGLPTLKLGVRFRAQLEGGAPRINELRYRDANFLGRAGWKEIIATGGEGVALLNSSVPQRDRSQELTDYPTDLLNSPPQDVEARVVFVRQLPTPEVTATRTPRDGSPRTRQDQMPFSSPLAGEGIGGGEATSVITPAVPHRGGGNAASDGVQASTQPARLEVNRQLAPRSSFTELITTQQLGLGMVLAAVMVSVGLGAFHALEPGHGKTVVAAYLVGSRGTARHAMILGLIVTVTHTAGVYMLGAVTLFASRYVVPERLYPWLGVTSGLIIAALGLSLFLRRYAGSSHTHVHHDGHSHGDGHAHSHDPGGAHSHTHGPHAHHHHVPAAVSLRELLALGVTGGIVPCPAALVVLLSALSMQRLGFGLLLIVAFSVGLAAVLIAIGILMVYAQHLMSRVRGDGVLISRWLPLTSAAVMAVFGLAIAVQALVSAGIVQIRL